MKTQLHFSPLGQGTFPRFSRIALLITAAIGSSNLCAAQTSEGSLPRAAIITMDCSMGQGRYIGNSLSKGTVHGELVGSDESRGALKVYESDQAPFKDEPALGGGPKLEYTMTTPSGKIVVWDVAEIYSSKIADYPDYIILTGGSGRFLKLKRLHGRAYWGGYTGIHDPEGGLEQILEYTPISCVAPSPPIVLKP